MQIVTDLLKLILTQYEPTLIDVIRLGQSDASSVSHISVCSKGRSTSRITGAATQPPSTVLATKNLWYLCVFPLSTFRILCSFSSPPRPSPSPPFLHSSYHRPFFPPIPQH